MKMYYVSHPYTGNEEQNKKEARRITAKLKKTYPNYIFINPLDVFTYAEDQPYGEILKQCLELLRECDGLILTGDWFKSRGCTVERLEAIRYGLEISYMNDGHIKITKQLPPEAEAVIEAFRKFITDFYEREGKKEC